MHTGMLWFDDSDAPLEKKIQKGADYYHKKYGRLPNLCLVHPSMILIPGRGPERVGLTVDKIAVRGYRPILPGHIWIGIEDMPTAPVESEPA